MTYNYFPATYQPFGYGMPQYSQQQFQQQQQPQIQNGIIWVSGDEEAEAFPIAPNNAVRLWHRTMPIVYFKSADASGKPSLASYDLVERTRTAQERTEPAESKLVDYTRKDELGALTAALEAVKKDIRQIKRQMREANDDDAE